LHHTDAAGILFFANLFILAHECYESFLEPEVTFKSIFSEQDLLMPIGHAEADYHKPLRVSDKIKIKLGLEDIGKSSFSLKYDFYTENGEYAATVKTSHVVKNKNGNHSISLPVKLKEKLLSVSHRYKG